jgi:hypothetical protein
MLPNAPGPVCSHDEQIRLALAGKLDHFVTWLGDNVPYIQFFPAIIVPNWYGGLGPGALATAT